MTESPSLASLVRETRLLLKLTQMQFAQKLGVSFQTVNRWENARTKPLPIALRQIEGILRQMGEGGKDLLTQYFSSGQVR